MFLLSKNSFFKDYLEILILIAPRPPAVKPNFWGTGGARLKV
jgi:hypothetical protein